MDASIGEAAEQKNEFNDIISSALGMRTDADLVSTDSTFNVLLTPRIKHIDQGRKIYKISRDQVFVQGIKTEYVVKTESVDLKFDFAWKNGKVNLVSAVGFDYADDSSIDEKAFKWFGRLNHLNSLQTDYVPNLLISKPELSHTKAFNKAYKLLKAAPTSTQFIEQSEFPDYISEINKEAKSFS